MAISAEQPIVIAGGGIGGLAAALALGRRGIAVRVLEQAPEFGAIGYGIQLAPNAFRVLAALGIEQEVLACAFEPSAVSMLDALDGHEICRIPTRHAIVERFGHPYAVLLRSELHAVLLDACGRTDAVALEANAAVASVDETAAGLTLRLQDGRVVPASALVGAEGLRSATRALLHVEGEPRACGYVAHRTILPVSDLPDGVFREDAVLWAGPGFHMVHYPLRGGALFNVVAVFQTSTHGDRLGPEGNRAEMLDAAKDALPPIRAVIDRMDLDRRWVLSDRDPVRRWSRGRVALAGDAAHPTLQSLAQGACMAIEDGVALAQQVALSPGDPAAAFEAYARKRLIRTARVQLMSREMWEVYHCGGIARDVRNATYAERSTADYHACLDWLWRGV